jgi:hypothetical protein
MRLGGHQRRSGSFGEEESFLFLWQSKDGSSVVRSVVWLLYGVIRLNINRKYLKLLKRLILKLTLVYSAYHP